MSEAQDISNIDAKLTQMEQTMRQMSDDQFTANDTIGQLTDPALSNVAGSINSHIRGIHPTLDQINNTLGTIDISVLGVEENTAVLGDTTDVGVGNADGTINAHLRGINSRLDSVETTLGTLATESTLQTISVAVSGGATGFFQQTTGITTTQTLTTVDLSSSAVSKFALQMAFVGDASAATVILDVSLGNDFTGSLNSIAQVTAAGTIVFVVDKAARFMRLRVTAITPNSGSITTRVFAAP